MTGPGYSRADLRRDLQRLSETAVTDKASLKAWYQDARRVQDGLAESKDEVPEFEFIMHYLIDADVRLKDPRYAAAQNEHLAVLLRTL